MNVPDAIIDMARGLVCDALKKWTRRPGALGAVFRRIEAVACKAASDAAKDAYHRGWNDANFASISALANDDVIETNDGDNDGM